EVQEHEEQGVRGGQQQQQEEIVIGPYSHRDDPLGDRGEPDLEVAEDAHVVGQVDDQLEEQEAPERGVDHHGDHRGPGQRTGLRLAHGRLRGRRTPTANQVVAGRDHSTRTRPTTPASSSTAATPKQVPATVYSTVSREAPSGEALTGGGEGLKPSVTRASAPMRKQPPRTTRPRPASSSRPPASTREPPPKAAPGPGATSAGVPVSG